MQNFTKIAFKKNLLHTSCLLGACVLLTACGGGGGNAGSNTAPRFQQTAYTFSLNEDQSINGAVSASDADGDTLAFTVSQSPLHGSLSVNRDGSFLYEPAANFFGEDTAVVGVSDSIAQATATMTFTVANVNDQPVIVTANVAVSSAGETAGNIVANDADNDPLVFSVVQQPERGEVTIDAATGAFTYSAANLSGVAGSFIVQVSDNIADPVQQEVKLSASFVTNQDKLNYYYTSEHSHLTQAIKFITVDGADDNVSISDAEVAQDGYSDIAVGYAQAGFATQAQNIITQQILARPTKAKAFVASANALDALGNTDTANSFRTQAVAEQNAYIAEVGLENIRSGDTRFYLEIVRSYLSAGESEAASELQATIRVFADTLIDNSVESTSAHRNFAVAASTHLEELVKVYLAEPTAAGHAGVVSSLNLLEHLADTVSFNENSRGVRYHNYRAFYYSVAARNALLISLRSEGQALQTAETIAKRTLAKAIALYGVSGYDNDHVYPVDEYSADTIKRFPTGASFLSGIFAALYPELVAAGKTETKTGNIPLDITVEEEGMRDLDTRNGYRDHYAYELLNVVRSGGDLAAKITEVETFFSQTLDYDRYIVETFVEQDPIGDLDKRAAWLMHYAGFNAEARQLLAAAMQQIESDSYQQDTGLNLRDVVGSDGCIRIAQLSTVFGGDAAAESAFNARCIALVDSHYAQLGDDVELDDRLKAFAWQSILHLRAGDTEKSNAALATALTDAAAFSDFDDQLKYRIYAASTAVKLGNFASLQTIWSDIHSSIMNELAATNGEEDKVKLLDREIFDELENAFFVGNIESFLDIHNLNLGVKHQAGVNAGYADARNFMQTASKQLLDELHTTIATFTDNAQQDLLPQLLKHYAEVGAYNEATNVALSNVFVDADRDEMFADIVARVAVRDDFPATTIASVDTDLDGLPNFFLGSATDQDIAASGLTLDEDSDNDGIPDSEDLQPLDAN